MEIESIELVFGTIQQRVVDRWIEAGPKDRELVEFDAEVTGLFRFRIYRDHVSFSFGKDREYEPIHIGGPFEILVLFESEGDIRFGIERFIDFLFRVVHLDPDTVRAFVDACEQRRFG